MNINTINNNFHCNQCGSDSQPDWQRNFLYNTLVVYCETCSNYRPAVPCAVSQSADLVLPPSDDDLQCPSCSKFIDLRDQNVLRGSKGQGYSVTCPSCHIESAITEASVSAWKWYLKTVMEALPPCLGKAGGIICSFVSTK